MFIYMDESGTLGSDSEYYIISAVVSYKPRNIEKHYYESINEARLINFILRMIKTRLERYLQNIYLKWILIFIALL